MGVSRYVRVRLTPDEAPPDAILGRTFLSQLAPQCKLDECMCAAAPDIAIDPSMGRLWSDVLPKDGRLLFEIATVLPYYLPNVEDKPDYIMAIHGRDYLVSLRVARVFFGAGFPADRGTTYLLAHLSALRSISQHEAGKGGVHVVPFKTFVSHRFEVAAPSAADAIEEHFATWRDRLVADIASLVEAMRGSSSDAAKHILPQLATPAFPTIWLFASGDSNRVVVEQFAGDLNGTALRALTKLTREQADRASDVLAGRTRHSPSDTALGLADSFAHYGFLDLAVVQVAVACESELWRTYSAFLLSRGCSKGKLELAETEITFSELLNVHVFAMCDVTKLADAQGVLGRVNWARKRRNEVVHGKGMGESSKAQVDDAIRAARDLVDFVQRERAAGV